MSSPTAAGLKPVPSRQPASLYSVSVFEVAERFSYTGMLTILVYYLYYNADAGGLGYSREVATAVLGTYGGLIYLSAVFGGWVSDRILGPERMLLLSAFLMLAGHVVLALVYGIGGLVTGLLLIALGAGAIKSTTGTIVSMLYEAGDPRRTAGFTIYYMAITLGALFGGIVTVFAQKSWGFQAGFGIAAAGMFIGLLVYVATRSRLPARSREVPSPASARTVLLVALGVLLAGAGAWWTLASGLVDMESSARWLVAVAALAAGAYFTIFFTSPRVGAPERRQVAGYIPVFIASTLLCALWLQLYTAVAVHAEAGMTQVLWGFELPPATAIALGPVFTILLGGPLAALWRRLGTREPGVLSKYALGLGLLAASYFVLGVFSSTAGAGTSVLLLVAVVGAFYVADLAAAPAGVSHATASAPAAYRTQMLSLHFLSFSIGAALSGWLAQYYRPEQALQYFCFTGAVAAGVAIALFLARLRGRAPSAGSSAGLAAGAGD